MSILPPLSSPPFTRNHLAEILSSEAVMDPYPHLLRWLIWFPLLSVEEITRLEQSRLARLNQTRSTQRVAALLQDLEEYQLVSHVVVNELGWPPHQHRYFLTDAGLYVYAAQSDPPLSVPRLAQSYAVERADLVARLARLDVHLALAAFATRLVAEGSIYNYLLTSFQQPWVQTDTIFGKRQTMRIDAAFLLKNLQGTEHAFYVRVDTDERRPFETRRERLLLLKLLNLRYGLRLQRNTMPRLLLLTRASHIIEWVTLLEKTCEHSGAPLLDGGVTTLEDLQQGGAYGLIWWTFAQLAQEIRNNNRIPLIESSVNLSDLMGPATSHVLAERFSQRRTFEHLLTERHSGPLRKTSRPLPSYIGKPLSDEIGTLRATTLADALRGTKAEQQEATALLNLALSATQKDLLFWLTHHPLLTIHHLAILHYPGGRDVRSVQRQMRGLSQLNLLVPFQWYGAHLWQVRERYVLSEAALRYNALREGRQPTYYLLSEQKKKKYKIRALSIQQGTAGLFAQMEHTHGLYNCMVRLVEEAHREKVRIITWKSAREIIRSYPDPFTRVPMQVRPDAEMIYQIEVQIFPNNLLVEYDRATTTKRDTRAKYQTYADYLDYTGFTLPPILVITQHDRAAELIRTCIDTVGLQLPAVILLEDQIQRQGLLPLLTLLNNSQ